MKYLVIQDNRRKHPVHVHALNGEPSHKAVERFQRNLAAVTPGGLNGVTWRVLEAPDMVSALIESV